MEVVGHGPEPADAHIGLGRTVLGADIRDVVRRVREGEIELERQRVVDVARERGRDRLERRAVEHRGRLAVRADHRLVVHGSRGMVEVELDVVLAVPDNLHRLPELLRQHRGFRREIRLALAPEAAAEKRHVAGDVLLVDAEGRRHRLLRGLRVLRRGPHLDLAVLVLRHRRRRLHRRVRQHRRRVGGLDHLAALGELGVHVAQVAHHLLRLPHRGDELLLVGFGLERGVGAVVPFDLQCLAAFERRPGVVGNHRHTAERLEHERRLRRRQRDGLAHALHRQRRLVVEALHRAAHDRRMLDRRVHHPLAERVEAERGLAGGDVAQVVDLAFLADEIPVGLVLELEILVLRHRQLRRVGDDRGKRQAAVALGMDEDAVLDGDLGRRHLPARGGRAHEHRAGGGAGAAERVVEVANGPRPVRVLVTVLRVAEPLLDAHGVPVGVELVGRHERQRGADAGAHLGPVRDDVDRPVGLDAEVDARVERGGLGTGADARVLRKRGLGQHLRGEHEGAGRERGAEEVAAADVFDEIHARPPFRRFAAVLMAARMRW